MASDPAYAVAHANLGMILARTGRPADAIVHTRRVVELTPDAADAHRNLGRALAEQGMGQEASAPLEEAIRLSDGKDPLALHRLGRADADLGRSSEALQTERRALSVAVQQNDALLARAVKDHLAELAQPQ